MTDWQSCLMMLRDLRGYILHRVTGRRCCWGVRAEGVDCISGKETISAWKGTWERSVASVSFSVSATGCSPPPSPVSQDLDVLLYMALLRGSAWWGSGSWCLRSLHDSKESWTVYTSCQTSHTWFFYVHVFISQVQSPDSHRTWRGSLTALIDLQADK